MTEWFEHLIVFFFSTSRWLFKRIGCILEGYIMYFLGCTSMFLMVAIAIERFVWVIKLILEKIIKLISILRFYVIYKPLNMRKIRFSTNIGVIVFCSLKGMFWATLPLFGWSRYTLEGALTSCSVEWKERSANVTSYNITIFVLVYFIPILCILSTSIKLLLIVVSDWVLLFQFF